MHEFEKPINASVFDHSLLGLPLQRVGYSDRTSWLMAAMSQLAYFKFENQKDLQEIAQDLAAFDDPDRTLEYLQTTLPTILASGFAGAQGNEDILKMILEQGNFELLAIYDAGGTQAFLARRLSQAGERNMMVLAFRGTEKTLSDWCADLNAKLVPPDPALSPTARMGRIHKGFQQAYSNVAAAIEKDIAKYPDHPLFLTGHSLGGALAVVATRFLSAENLAACYTYGGPRVGDLELAWVFKTPIYRIVNAADAVPRVPLGHIWYIFLWILRSVAMLIPRFKVLDFIENKMSQLAGYTHYGDMRYLTHAEPGPNDTYPGLQLVSNPNFFWGIWRFFNRTKATRGMGLVRDHAIGIYRAKLRSRAISRN